MKSLGQKACGFYFLRMELASASEA